MLYYMYLYDFSDDTVLFWFIRISLSLNVMVLRTKDTGDHMSTTPEIWCGVTSMHVFRDMNLRGHKKKGPNQNRSPSGQESH